MRKFRYESCDKTKRYFLHARNWYQAAEKLAKIKPDWELDTVLLKEIKKS